MRIETTAVKSEDLVELFRSHCDHRTFRKSVYAFLRQFGVVNRVSDWREASVLAAAFIRATETKISRDRSELKRAMLPLAPCNRVAP